MLQNLFKENRFRNAEECIKIIDMQKQEGVKDCGLFSKPVDTEILFGEEPSCLHINKYFTPFSVNYLR